MKSQHPSKFPLSNLCAMWYGIVFYIIYSNTTYSCFQWTTEVFSVETYHIVAIHQLKFTKWTILFSTEMSWSYNYGVLYLHRYCMPWTRHIMQSIEVPVVTQTRVSDDYSPSNSQWIIGDTTIIAHAMGLAVFKDVRMLPCLHIMT